MSSIRQQLTSIYYVFLGKNLDAKSLQYWERSILNNLSTIDDFKKFIYKEPEYAANISIKFERLCSEYGVELNFTVFWENVFSGEDVSDDTILNYVWKNKDTQVSIRNKIVNLFEYEFGQVPTQDIIEYYLDTPVQLSTLVDNICLRKHMELDTSKAILARGENKDGNSKETHVANFSEELLTAFESVFARPMFVQEYFKYAAFEIDEIDFHEVHMQHTNNYNKLRKIFETYTGKTISEYYYVTMYLNSVDDQSFFDGFINNIVASNDYRNGMSTVIKEKYASMFDQTLDEADIEYVFKIIKEQKLDIVNEKITTILNQFKEETDEFVSRIFAVYMKVLERAPDIQEIEKYVAFYRVPKSNSDGELERILINTLEFHDILKKKIKAAYSKRNGKDVSSSVLFDTLHRVLTKLPEITMQNVEVVINELW
jgi:hypothetical protein